MNLGLSYLSQIVDGFTQLTIGQVMANVGSGYHTQHNTDDTHSKITATDSITERSRTAPMGVWITAPFSAGAFSATTGSTWTVTQAQVIAFAYMLVGSTMTIAFYIDSSTLSVAAAAQLFITIPGNFTITRRIFNSIAYDDNGTRGTGLVTVRPNSIAQGAGLSLELTKDLRASTTWSTSSSLSVAGEITFEIHTSDVQSQSATTFVASGGTITTSGGKTIHTFTTSGSFVVAQGNATVTYLVVAGGGSGASNGGGGGGAGGVLTGSTVIVPGTYTITVGTGGTPALNFSGNTGNNSSFGSVATAHGGGGGAWQGDTGASGGSGGGGGGLATLNGGLGTSGEGHSGAAGDGAGTGGGGGGAGLAASGANGGNGVANSISGTSVTYGGGGGGGGVGGGTGGTGGGGNGSGGGNPTSGTNGRGGGGGGSDAAHTSGTGGDGIVILSYTTP